MSEKPDIISPPEDAPEKTHIPIKNLALSLLAGIAALALFWCCYYLFAPRTAVGMAELSGTYTLSGASRGDISLIGQKEPDTASIRLDADGKCRVYAGERSLYGRWELENGTLSLRCAGTTLTGTAVDGTLTLTSDYDSAVTLLFSRTDLTGNAAGIPAGKYSLTAIDDNGTGYTGSVIDAAEPGGWYISVKADGSGSAAVFSSEAENISVEGECIVLRGMRLGYTLDHRRLIVNYPGGITLTFERQN